MDATGIESGTILTRRKRLHDTEISEVVFAPDHRLTWHGHPHTCLAVVIDGGVHKRFVGAEEQAAHGTVIEMPAQERHEDLFGPDGARIVVIESDRESGGPRCFRDPRATVLAHHISRELGHPDAYTPLALEGLALELAAAVGRHRELDHHEPRLDTVREMLSQDLASPPLLSQIAREVGLHPSHLARVFRARFGESIGEHGRRLRLEWAADRLVCSDEGLASIAARGGFADQSHFTREFKRRFGVTPGRYRLAHR